MHSSFEEKEPTGDVHSRHDKYKYDELSWDDKVNSVRSTPVVRTSSFQSLAVRSFSPVTSESDGEIPPPPPEDLDSSDYSEQMSFCVDVREHFFSNPMECGPRKPLYEKFDYVEDDVSFHCERKRYTGDCSYEDFLGNGDGKSDATSSGWTGNRRVDCSSVSGIASKNLIASVQRQPLALRPCISIVEASDVNARHRVTTGQGTHYILLSLFRIMRTFTLRCGFDHWKRVSNRNISFCKIHDFCSSGSKILLMYERRRDALDIFDRLMTIGMKRSTFTKFVSHFQ